jgi:hypothetical protein
METIYEMFEYLPLQYKEPSDLEYFEFLKSSVLQNYEAKNYHFALVAVHMIYMGIVYHYIYAISKADKKRFDYVLIGFHDSLENKKVKDFENLSWHNFSIINESTIFQFYRAVGITKGDIKILKKPVSERNDITHSNGSFVSEESEFEKRLEKYLQNMVKIDDFCRDEYLKLYNKFLRSIKIKILDESEALGYLEQDFIKEYGVNIKTIKWLSRIKKGDYPKNVNILFNTLKNL